MIYTFFLSIFVWGPGLVAIGLTIFTGLLSLGSYAIFSVIKRPRDKNLRRIYMSISYVMLFSACQFHQCYVTRGENLKAFLIDNEIAEEFVLKNSDVFFGGGESEIWLQLESNKSGIEKLIHSNRLELVKEQKTLNPDYFPDWWPINSADYFVYEYNETRTEQLYRLLRSQDDKLIYYYYLYY